MMEGQTLSHYKVLEKLGGGGMGVVYKALDTHLDRHVALKLLPPELTRDDGARERFVLEAKAASALDHPNICTIHDIDETPDGQMFIAMGYYEGETLKKRIERGPLQVEDALDIAIQVAQGLTKAHASSIVHRDIKPANVIVTTDGLVKIVDFGIAKLLGVTGPTQTGTTLGTVSYMSPEQIAGDDADQQSDVWSLGAVLYEMLTGQPPFKGESQWAVMNAISNRDPALPSAIRPDIPSQAEHIVMRALKKAKDQRYVSAAELLTATKSLHTELTVPIAAESSPGVQPQSRFTPTRALATLLVVVAIGMSMMWWWNSGADARWAREEAIPEIMRLIDQDSLMPAVELAKRVEAILPDDPDLAELWPLMTIERGIQTEPEGVSVSYRSPDGSDDDWVDVGETPIEYARIPRVVARWRFEREGFNTAEFLSAFLEPTIQLSAQESVPTGMIRVASTQLRVGLAGFAPKAIQTGPFLVGQYEVTNAQFKEFVDAGGYDDPGYWTHQLVTDGQVVPWPEAMAGFRDLTGRPGPSTWQVGSHPDGEDMFPVRGVSWYEAAAYAEFRGKSLPTIYHWGRAAFSFPTVGPELIPLSNFGNVVLPVGTTTGVSGVGAFDMAGNAREWVWNEAEPGHTRYILGGSWNDPASQLQHADTRSPFDRSEENGFRLVQYLGDPPAPELTDPLPAPTRDYTQETPVSDEVFEVYRNLYAYDARPLDAVVESSDAAVRWRKEVASFSTASGAERMTATLYLPNNAAPPFQTVLYFPGAQVIGGGLARQGEIDIAAAGYLLSSTTLYMLWSRSG